MRNKPYISYNPFFVVPFLLWVIAGGFLLSRYSKEYLFTLVNSRNTAMGDNLMYCTTWMGQAEVIVPVLLLLLLLPAFRNWWYLATAVVCNVAPLIIQQILKSWYDAPRPMNYFHSASWVHILPDWPHVYYRSFPSGHSEGAFSFFCFLSLLLPPRYSKLGLVFCILALAVCYSRIYLAAHFFDDVYAGSIIGMVTTTVMFSVMVWVRGKFFKNEGTFVTGVNG